MSQSRVKAAVTVLIGFSILCLLGIWQIQRLEWKNEILQKLNAEYARPENQLVITPEELTPDVNLKRITIRGVYDFKRQILIGPRTLENVPGQNLPGYHVLTPLKFEDNTTLMIDRGWVPQHWKPDDEITPPDPNTQVTGLLRVPDSNAFTPDNNPGKNEWYKFDAPQIAQTLGLSNLKPYVLYLEGPMTEHYPLPQSMRPEFPNNHLFYAIFWFTMAGILLLMGFLRFYKTRSPPSLAKR